MPASSNQRVHSVEIQTEIGSLIDTDLASALGLVRTTQLGSLEHIPVQSLTSQQTEFPITFVKPTTIDFTQEGPGITTRHYGMSYFFRIVYVDKLADSEDANNSRQVAINMITEILIDNFKLSGLSLTNGDVLWLEPIAIDLEPPEEAMLDLAGLDAFAAALIVRVMTRTRRTP